MLLKKYAGVWKMLQLLCLLGLVFGLRFYDVADVLVQGQVYFLDGDCYARMTRVQEVLEEPGRIVRHHAFENWPEGTTPHTTAPLDYLIAGLATLLRPFSSQPVDLAGALISPLLGLATAGFLWWWLGDRRYRGMALLLFAVSPGLIHATAFGRPDHQSLLLLLLAIALGAELRLAEGITRGWALVAGASWGMALWVSMFEPLILLGAILALWLAGNRCGLIARERLMGWALMGGILLLALLLEGWRSSSLFDARARAWFSTIGELQTGWGLLRWVGLGALLSPLLWLWKPTRDRRWAALAVLVLLAGLSFANLRWGYFFVLAYAMTLPWQLDRCRRAWLVWLVWLVGIVLAWPVWQELDAMLPGGEDNPLQAEARADQAQLRDAAEWLRQQPEGAVMAPWWQSPALVYWSGHPAVAGSSHESLPGIEASARFFLTVDQPEGRSILRQRRASYVLAYDADRVMEAYAPLVGKPAAPDATMAAILYRTPRSAPPFLRHEYSNAVFKVFSVVEDNGL